jgi:hypothetical protein
MLARGALIRRIALETAGHRSTTALFTDSIKRNVNIPMRARISLRIKQGSLETVGLPSEQSNVYQLILSVIFERTSSNFFITLLSITNLIPCRQLHWLFCQRKEMKRQMTGVRSSTFIKG